MTTLNEDNHLIKRIRITLQKKGLTFFPSLLQQSENMSKIDNSQKRWLAYISVCNTLGQI
jgi:hypothetical protein